MSHAKGEERGEKRGRSKKEEYKEGVRLYGGIDSDADQECHGYYLWTSSIAGLYNCLLFSGKTKFQSKQRFTKVGWESFNSVIIDEKHIIPLDYGCCLLPVSPPCIFASLIPQELMKVKVAERTLQVMEL